MHWIEQLDHNHEVVRVACDGGKYTHRVVVNGNASWRVEERRGSNWVPLRWLVKRARWYRDRLWRSPQAAMRHVETLTKGPARE